MVNKPITLTNEESDFVERMVNKHKSVINNVIRVTLSSEFSYLYEDCVSETYLLICKNVKELKNHPAPDGWVVLAAKNMAKKLQKEEMRRANRSALLKEVHSDGEDVFEDVFYNMMLEDNTAEKIVETFTPREKDVYQMVYVQGIGFAETAEKLGVSASTVRNLHKSLKDKVRKYIKDYLR